MNDVSKKIAKILSLPKKNYTKQEAIKALQKCGVLNKYDKIVEAYKDIFVSKDI